jgi:undecaprenyl-diphosphatase
MNATSHAGHSSAESPVRHEVAGRVLRAIVLPALFLYVLLVGVGLLLAHPLARAVRGEDEINRDLADGRSSTWTGVTGVFSTLANTPAVIATLVVLMVVLRLVYKRWRESFILAGAVVLQAVVFLGTTLVVDRPRPAVPHLDPAPPTSSFPSGHTGATTALYLTLALVIGWRLRPVLLRVLVFAVLVTVPVAVALSRLYRGMHHPTDVVFGMLNGLACLAIAAHAFGPVGRSGDRGGARPRVSAQRDPGLHPVRRGAVTGRGR